MKSKVVVTGLGLSTSLGQGVSENWTSMLAGKSNFKHSRRLRGASIRTSFAAVDERFEEEQDPRLIIECYMKEVVAEAVAQAGGGVFDRLYYSLPSGVYYWGPRMDALRDPEQVRPDAFERFSSEEGLSRFFYETYQLQQYPAVVSTACASSASAIQLGYEAIMRGYAKRVIVAAADSSIYEETVSKFNNLSALSTRNDSPANACRPFSASRDGFVIGEGGGCIILELDESAQAHDRLVLAYLAGCGNTTDNVHRTKGDPSGAGIRNCIVKAIADAGLQPEQISCVNAHGTSTPENDRMESKIIKEVFVGRPIVTSSKSLLGHTVHAAGVIEAVVSVLSLQHQTVTPTLNYDGSLDAEGVKVAAQTLENIDLQNIISNSFGFGGQNVSLVFARAEQHKC